MKVLVTVNHCLATRRPLVIGLVGTVAFSTIVVVSARAEEGPESRFFDNPRQITQGFTKAGEGYFSPDGKSIVYQAVPEGYPFYKIYLEQPASSEPRRISSGRGRTTCSFF